MKHSKIYNDELESFVGIGSYKRLKNWANAFISLFQHTNNTYKSIKHDSIAMFSLKKTLHPGETRTRVFCSWSGCNVDCATPPQGRIQTISLKRKSKFKSMYAPMRNTYVCTYQCTCKIFLRLWSTMTTWRLRKLHTYTYLILASGMATRMRAKRMDKMFMMTW
jgi:hypothetical protein